MNKIWTLLKVDFLNNQNFLNMEFRGKDKIKNILLVVLLLFILAPLYTGFLLTIWAMFDFFLEIGQARLFLQLGIGVSQIVILLFSLPKILNSFYYDSDIEVLVPFPLNNYDILASKFISILLREYGKVLLIYFPFLFTFAYKTGAGILYWVYGLISMITLPIFPLALVSVLVIVLMKYTNIGKNKDLVRGLGMVVLAALIILMQMAISRLSGVEGNIGPENIMKLLSDNMDILSLTLDRFIPMAFLFGNGLYNYSSLNGFIYMIFSFGVNVGLFFLMLYLGEKLYMDGFLKGSLLSKTKEDKKSKKLSYKGNRPYLAIAKKELIMLIKIPIYFFNSVMGSIIIPLIFLISFSLDKNMMESIDLLGKGNSTIPIAVFVGAGIFLNLTGPGATSFSREGKSFWIQKHLPIRASDQAKGRILVSLVLQVLSCLILGIIGVVVFSFNILDIIIMSIYIILLSLPIISMSLIFDIKKPKLNWTSPAEAMKQNMNVVKIMIVTFIYIGILAAASVFLYRLGDIYLYIVMGLLGIGLSKLTYTSLTKIINREMSR